MDPPKVIFVRQIQITFCSWCFLRETGGGEREGYSWILLLVPSGELIFFLNALIDITHYEALCCEV